MGDGGSASQAFMHKGPDVLSKDRPRVLALLQVQQASIPSLAATIERLGQIKCVDDIAVVATLDIEANSLALPAIGKNIPLVRAVPDDLLSCFARCAEMFGADAIIWVKTPLADLEHVDHLVRSLLAQHGDFVLDETASGPRSVDVFSRRALDRLMMDARTDPLARRQVTAYLKAFPHFVRVVRATPVAQTSSYQRAQAAHERLEARSGEGSLGDLLGLVGSKPGRTAVHGLAGAHVLIRCGESDGNTARVRRAVAIARALRDNHGIVANFVISGVKEGFDLVRRSGFEAERARPREEDAQLCGVASRIAPLALILDCEDGPSLLEVTRLKREVRFLATIDDLSNRRRLADVAYVPPLPQFERLDWTGTQAAVRVGWQWIVVRSAQERSRSQAPALPTVLVAMGTSGSARLTLLAATALAKLPTVCRARFLIPSRLADRSRLARAVVALKPGFETIEGTDELSTELDSADLALTDAGSLSYDLAAAGVPAIYLSATEDDSAAAAVFERVGMGVALANADTETVAVVTHQLLSDSQRRRDMRAAALMTIDQNGANRIAGDLATLLSQRQSNMVQAKEA